MLGLLGLDPLDSSWASATGSDAGMRAALDSLVEVLVTARENARARRDFAEADMIRDRLRAAGVELEDTAHGPRWSVAR